MNLVALLSEVLLYQLDLSKVTCSFRNYKLFLTKICALSSEHISDYHGLNIKGFFLVISQVSKMQVIHSPGSKFAILFFSVMVGSGSNFFLEWVCIAVTWIHGDSDTEVQINPQR